MLYYLFTFLDEVFDVPGAGVFRYISFRSIGAISLSLVLTILLGKYVLKMLARWQIRESVRKLGLPGEEKKEGTPTMGGLMIIGASLISILLFARPDNVYVWLLIVTVLLMGLVGFVDDYIKVFRKNKHGLKAITKLAGQAILGLILGVVLAFHPDVTVRKFFDSRPNDEAVKTLETPDGRIVYFKDEKTFSTTLPFLKHHTFQYEWIASRLGIPDDYTWIVFVIVVVLINTAVSNAVNLTDGLDGLAAGTSAIALGTLALFAYVSGHVYLSDYLNIMYIPGTGELVVAIAALLGATVGFLWYNAYPAQVFMGDTGSLMLGSVIGVLSIVLRKELMLPLLCAVFFIEALSVIIQVGYFKWTKWRSGRGKRVFLMAPLHHHYQLKGWHENKIVVRFWLIAGLSAAASLVLLKLR